MTSPTLVALRDLGERFQAERALPSPAARRALRRAVGASLGDVARVVGVSREAVRAWEAGEYKPRGAHLTAYLEVLQLFRESA